MCTASSMCGLAGGAGWVGSEPHPLMGGANYLHKILVPCITKLVMVSHHTLPGANKEKERPTRAARSNP